MGMTRFGGMAEVGKAYDEYGNKTGMSTGTKTALAGVGVGALGAHQLAGSRNVGTQAAITQQRAEEGYRTAKKKWQRAASTAYDARVGQRLSPGPVKVLHRGKVKRSGAKEEALAAKYEKAKIFRTNARNANTAEAIAGRVRNKRIAGAALLAGGAITGASPLFKRKPQPVAVEPVAYAKADISTQSGVSKTISQARYGGNAEAGRAWRGEDRKDVPKEIHAIGAGGTAALGGGTAALAAHRNRPAKMADRTGELTSARNAAGDVYRTSREKQLTLDTDLRRAKLYSGTGDYLGLRRLRAKHGMGGRENPVAQKRKPGQMMGGHIIGGIEERHKVALKDVAQHKKGVEAAHEALAAHPKELAENASSRIKFTRVKRAGLGVAALGGLTAAGAAAKIEHDRRSGWGKPKRPGREVLRRRPAPEPEETAKEFTPTEMARMQANADRYRQKVGLSKTEHEPKTLNMKSKAKKKKSSKLSGMGDWKTHAESDDVGKELKEDLTSVKRRLRTLPEEDKFALEAKVKGNIRMREGKEDEDDAKKVKRRIKDLPKSDKFALEQDLHAKSIKLGKGLVPKIVANSPASLPFEFGVAATKNVTPRPIRNVVRSGRNRYVQGAQMRTGMSGAERRELREAQQMMLRNRGYA